MLGAATLDVKEIVEQLVRAVVHQSDAAAIKALRGERSVLIEVQVAPEDVGLLIGRDGSTIRAIRHLARVIGARRRQRVEVTVLNETNKTGVKKPRGR